MQSVFWPDWAKILEQRGLKSLTCIALDRARPLFLILSQILILGYPLVNGLPISDQYQALIRTLAEEDNLVHFLAFLREEPL